MALKKWVAEEEISEGGEGAEGEVEAGEDFSSLSKR